MSIMSNKGRMSDYFWISFVFCHLSMFVVDSQEPGGTSDLPVQINFTDWNNYKEKRAAIPITTTVSTTTYNMSAAATTSNTTVKTTAFSGMTSSTVNKTTFSPAALSSTSSSAAVNNTVEINETALTKPLDLFTLNFSLVINRTFDWTVHTTTNTDLKTKLQTLIDSSYRSVNGYQANSAVVTGFRPSWLTVDFSIIATSSVYLVSANKNVTKGLAAIGLNGSSYLFTLSDEGGLYGSNRPVYPGQRVKLVCNTLEVSNIVWTKNGAPMPQRTIASINTYMRALFEVEEPAPSYYVLQNVTPGDTGEYACISTWNSMPYVSWQKITIQPYPIIEATNDKVIRCSKSAAVQCCVQDGYRVEWVGNPTAVCNETSADALGCFTLECVIKEDKCQINDTQIRVTYQVKSGFSVTDIEGGISYDSRDITITASAKAFSCYNAVFGSGDDGITHTAECNSHMVGTQSARCRSGQWTLIENNCVLRVIESLSVQSENLFASDLPAFMSNLSETTGNMFSEITASLPTVLRVVQILKRVADASQTVLINNSIMMNFLKTLDVIGSNDARKTWVDINQNNTIMRASSDLLKSVEDMGHRLSGNNFNITTSLSQLIKTEVTSSFSGTFGKYLTTQINIPEINGWITVILSSTLENILPNRTSCKDCDQTHASINGDIVLVQTESSISKVSFSFNVKNETLEHPQCVFWNFSLLNGVGGWDPTGCEVKLIEDPPGKVICECNHTTAFSMLMSPEPLNDDILDYITYCGVGISIACLVLCLVIETIIWKSVTKTDISYMRHVSIVNITVSLLIANICFIVGAAVRNNEDVNLCIAATFFSHFFYLSLFFWMLLSALLLLYCTIVVFPRMSRGEMLSVAFTIGYGAPLLIAAVTIGVTAENQGYIQKESNCWLNWDQTKALLAFVIPALTIIVINLLVLVLVLCKILSRRRNHSYTQPDEKHVLLVIGKCVGVLTPIFGLTWGFGLGTMLSLDFWIHGVFAFLNSLQGFFILVFGVLLDSKITEAVAERFALENFRSNLTGGTNTGQPSSSGNQKFKHGYNAYS